MSMHTTAGAALVRLMGEMPRGPRREGLFALWLTLRVTEDLLLVPPHPERLVRRRVAALEQRLSSLSFPAPLRRALVAALAELRNPAPAQAAMVLQQLVAPAREAIGAEAGDVVAKSAKAARAAG